MMIESYERMLIDIMLLNKINTKQTPWNQDKIKQKLRKLGREIHVEIADSGKWDLTTKEWLPGRILSAVQGKIT